MKKMLILTASPVAGGNSNAMASAFEVAAIKKGALVTRLANEVDQAKVIATAVEWVTNRLS